VEVIFLNAVEYRLRFPLDVRHCFKMTSLQFQFQFGKQSEITVAPKFRSFLSHTSSQASQNVTEKVRVDHSVRRNKFTVNNPLHVEKNNKHALCWTLDLSRLFCSWGLWALPLWRLLLCFWIITVKVNPTFVTRYDPRS
jgi:hypothetical protein